MSIQNNIIHHSQKVEKTNVYQLMMLNSVLNIHILHIIPTIKRSEVTHMSNFFETSAK